MQIIVTARHVKITDEIREYAETKAGKLLKFYDRIQKIDVILDHAKEQFSAEVIVRDDHTNQFVASETGPDTPALIDIVMEKVERQILKHKRQLRDH